MTYQVYILQNASGRFYVGQTDDLDRRLASHNRTDKTAGKFTRKNGPWSLVSSMVGATQHTCHRQGARKGNQGVEIGAPDPNTPAGIK